MTRRGLARRFVLRDYGPPAFGIARVHDPDFRVHMRERDFTETALRMFVEKTRLDARLPQAMQ